MIYISNKTSPQRIYIPRTEVYVSATGSSEELQSKNYEISSNGVTIIRPDAGYGGISGGTIDVSVPDRYYEGFENGFVSGETVGFSSGETIGFNSGYTEGYSSGETDGMAAQKALLSDLTATTNALYTSETGYSGVTVNVPERYNEGYHDGIEYQKSLLTDFTATTNGLYTSETGYSAVTVETSGINNQNKELTLTSSDSRSMYSTPMVITPDSGYTGLGSVSIKTNFRCANDIYCGEITGNGYYNITSNSFPNDYFKSHTIYVNVDDSAAFASGYTSGLTDGIESQKALLSDFTATTNGLYTSETGYSGFTVNVDDSAAFASGYTSGLTDGMEAQKSLLGSLSVTSLTTSLTNQDGWSAVTVNPAVDAFSISIDRNGDYSFRPEDYNLQAFTSITLHLEASELVKVISAVYNIQSSAMTFSLYKNYSGHSAIMEIAYIKITDENGNTYLFDNPSPQLTSPVSGRITVEFYCTTVAPNFYLQCDELESVTIFTPYIDDFKTGNLCGNLSSVTFDASATVKYIPYSFCSVNMGPSPLTAITIPDSVYDIGGRAFENSDLHSIDIGSNVRTIGYKAFYGNQNLSTIISRSSYAPDLGTMVFDQVASTGTLYIPSGANYSTWVSALPSGWTVSNI